MLPDGGELDWESWSCPCSEIVALGTAAGECVTQTMTKEVSYILFRQILPKPVLKKLAQEMNGEYNHLAHLAPAETAKQEISLYQLC